jgi:hypothetical protein
LQSVSLVFGRGIFDLLKVSIVIAFRPTFINIDHRQSESFLSMPFFPRLMRTRTLLLVLPLGCTGSSCILGYFTITSLIVDRL